MSEPQVIGFGSSFVGRSLRVQVVLVGIVLSALCVPGPLLAQDRDSIHGSALTATPAIAELLDPFRGRLDSDDVADVLERRKRYTGFPRNAEEHVLAARLWWRAGRPAQALRELDELRDEEVGPLSLLERARVLLETDSARAAGVEAWWAACEAIDEPARAEVAWDILPLTTPEEREAWPKLQPGSATCDWLRDFWNERAQRMAISADERLALHYRRLAHAREWYWIPRPYFRKAPADFHGRPDDLAIDDRGLIYVRMGAPLTDEGFTTGGAGEPGAGVGGDTNAGGAGPGLLTGLDLTGLGAGEVRRCWPYWRPDGYRIYCFRGGRLGQGVPGRPGTAFFHRYVVNSNLPESVIRHRIRRRVWPGLRAPWELALDRVEARAWERHGVVRTRENIDEALKEVPDVPRVRASANVSVEILRFLNPGSRRWQIWTFASVRAGDLRAAPGPDGDAMLAVGGRYSVLEAEGVRIRPFREVRTAASSVGEDWGLALSDVFSAEPGRLPLTVVVEDLNEPGSGNWYQDTINVPSVRGLPQLSDVAIAEREGGAWTRDGETFLEVTPSHITNPDGSIHAYFEVYGVNPGARYEVDVRLAPTESSERIWRLEPDDLSYRLRFTTQMEGEIGRHHLRLDLADTDPGEYTLAVRIQAADTQYYSLPSVTDVLVPEP